MNGFRSRSSAVLGVAFCMALMAADTADAARRGGGFGSRGARTYQAPPPTKTAPQPAQPIQRSMTQPAPGAQTAAPKATAPTAAPAAARAAQPPRRGGMMGGLLGGLLLGGLIGAALGNGFGAGMMGFMSVLLQLAVVAGVVFLLVKLFRRRSHQPAMAGAATWPNPAAARAPYPQQPQDFGATASPRGDYTPGAAPGATTPVEILITPKDRDAFERLLMDVQDALGREDYGALRERTTPEVMGFLAEDMAQNATEGRRNEIFGTKLLEADVAEAWREDDREYATAALRYEALDVTRDRATGAVLDGDPDRPTQTTELWTFVRHQGGPWKLSAIQEA